MKNRIVAVLGAVGVVATLTACGVVANPSSDQKALVYDGGAVVKTSQKFKACVDPAVFKRNGSGDKVYYYPNGLRSYKFSSDEGSDTGPLTSSTKDTQEISVKGTVSFTFNTDCTEYTDAAGKVWKGGKLQKFHETIGRKFQAYTESEDSEPSDGWDRMLGTYVRDVVDRAVDNEALKYNWKDLYNDAGKKSQWERDVVAAIPALVKAQAGEDFFTINNVLLQKPDISQGLKARLSETQEAVQRGETAAIDREIAAKWPGGPTAYAAWLQANAITKAITDGKVQVIPVPIGGSVNITPK